MSNANGSPPPGIEPPFRGFVETTFDALLMFEAARRGMIPRVTRRLHDVERLMVQSGGIFVFDEGESGIKRWTDGHVWSPSRILGNFLVYREQDKKGAQPPTPMSSSGNMPSSSQASPSAERHGSNSYVKEESSAFGRGALTRPRSSSEGQDAADLALERKLFGSLIGDDKYKRGGMAKKTMSVTVNGLSQHLISYYSKQDYKDGRLRTPSSIPELASLEISPEYLHRQNFRFPPVIEVGSDGIPRYRGEADEPGSPQSPLSNMSVQPFPMSPNGEMYDQYGQAMRMPNQSPSSRPRSVTVPMPLTLPSPGGGSYGTSPASGQFYDGNPRQSGIHRQESSSSLASSGGPIRPSSSRHRQEPYESRSTSPRTSTAGSMHVRRLSQTMVPPPGSSAQARGGSDFFPSPTYEMKPPLSPDLSQEHHNPYSYQPPATAPGSFADFGAFTPAQPPVHSPGAYGPTYAAWHAPSPSSSGRMAHPPPREYAPVLHSPQQSHAHTLPHHSHSHSGGGQALGVLMEGQPSGDSWSTHETPVPGTPGHVSAFGGHVPQGWDGQFVSGDSTEWRGQGTSVG